MAKYYTQRASAGLIVTEATQISPQGIGYVHTPGIHSAEQVAGWKLVTDAVHAKGGHMCLQLWHVGRISHPDLQPGGALPVAPSAVKPEMKAFTVDGFKDIPAPRALELSELPGIVEDYRRATRNALAAGFDMAEVHAANGYLIDQFLRDGTNKRTDRYGGSVENRARFLVEVTEAVVGVWGPERVGVRLSPNGAFNSMHDSNPRAIFGHVAKELQRLNLAYLHFVRAMPSDDVPGGPIDADFFRPLFKNAIVSAGGFTDKAQAEAALKGGNADLAAFATLFISNPDLPARFKQNAPLTPADRATFYGGDAKGYTDYPTLEAAVA
jgi:N-ethylmaleimide reductase